MSDTPASPASSRTEPRFAPGSPSAAVLPGVVLLFSGLWMVTDNGPVAIGWAFFSVGLAFLMVGAVAWGVAWGLALHAERQR